MDCNSLWASSNSKQYLAKQNLKMLALVHMLVHFEVSLTLVNYVRKVSFLWTLSIVDS